MSPSEIIQIIKDEKKRSATGLGRMGLRIDKARLRTIDILAAYCGLCRSEFVRAAIDYYLAGLRAEMESRQESQDQEGEQCTD